MHIITIRCLAPRPSEHFPLLTTGCVLEILELLRSLVVKVQCMHPFVATSRYQASHARHGSSRQRCDKRPPRHTSFAVSKMITVTSNNGTSLLQSKVELMLATGCTDSEARFMLARHEGDLK